MGTPGGANRHGGPHGAHGVRGGPVDGASGECADGRPDSRAHVDAVPGQSDDCHGTGDDADGGGAAGTDQGLSRGATLDVGRPGTMAATGTKVDGCGLGPHGGVRNDVPRHSLGDTYTDEDDDGIFPGSRADEPAVLQPVGDGSRVGAAFDEAGVRTRLPPEGAVHPLSRRQSRQASPSTRAGAAEQRAAAQDTGATSPTSSVAPTEVVFEAASSLLFGMDNLNNGDPQFDPRASTTPAAEGTGRRGRSQRRHGEQRPATSQDPPPPEPTMNLPPAFRRPLVAAPVPWASTPPIRSSFPPARMPTEPAQAPDPWDMPASSQAGMDDDQSAHDRDSSARLCMGGCQTTVRDGGPLQEQALRRADRGDREGDDRRVPAAQTGYA